MQDDIRTLHIKSKNVNVCKYRYTRTWLRGCFGRRGTGKRGQPRTLKRVLRSDFLLMKKTRDKWFLSQCFHESPFLEEYFVLLLPLLLLLCCSSSLMGSSDNGASRLIIKEQNEKYYGGCRISSAATKREERLLALALLLKIGEFLSFSVFGSVHFLYTQFLGRVIG